MTPEEPHEGGSLLERYLAPQLVVNHDAPPVDLRAYVAHAGENRRTPGFQVRDHAQGVAYTFPYSAQLITCLDYPGGAHLTITLPGISIVLNGKKLGVIQEALRLEVCSLIQDFDARYFDAPNTPDLPFIESLTIENLRAEAALSSSA